MSEHMYLWSPGLDSAVAVHLLKLEATQSTFLRSPFTNSLLTIHDLETKITCDFINSTWMLKQISGWALK